MKKVQPETMMNMKKLIIIQTVNSMNHIEQYMKKNLTKTEQVLKEQHEE